MCWLQDEVLQGQEDLQNQVSDVHSSITTVQSRLQDMEQSFLLNQDYANQGIHLLCKCAPHTDHATLGAADKVVQLELCGLGIYINTPAQRC